MKISRIYTAVGIMILASTSPALGDVLHDAARKGDTATVKALLKAGADVHATDRHGQTALHVAAGQGRTEVITSLLAAGADVHATLNYGGRTALHWAASTGHAETVTLLLEAGADVHATDNRGGNALKSAVLLENAEVIKPLLEAGADVQATKDEYGLTALEMAAGLDRAAIFMTLHKAAQESFAYAP